VRELRDIDLERDSVLDAQKETEIMNEFMRPASVVPSLAMSTKMSPGVASS
jgi:hypothetical protein